MPETLWDKYKGKSPTMEEIFRDDYIPMVKNHIENGKSVKESTFEAFKSIGCQLPFWTVAPFDWISKARDEIK